MKQQMWVLCMAGALAGAGLGKYATVVVGDSIAGVRLGMTLSEVRKLGIELVPEGIDREIGVGWMAGPLLVIFDDKERAMTVSLDLRRSAGAKIGKIVIPALTKLDDIAKLIPGCTLSMGSGGRALACKNEAGKVTNFYDSYGSNELWVIMP